MISGRRERVDSAVDNALFWPEKSTSKNGRQVDYFLSKLLRYSYIPDNKGKVDRKSFGGGCVGAFMSTLRVVWKSCLPVYRTSEMGGAA